MEVAKRTAPDSDSHPDGPGPPPLVATTFPTASYEMPADVIIVDVNADDPTLPMPCPSAAFLQPRVVEQYARALT